MNEHRAKRETALRGPAKEESGDVGQHGGLKRLTAYRQGTLPEAEREAVQEHLSLCPHCTGLLLELQGFEENIACREAGLEALRQQAWDSFVRRLAAETPAVQPIAGTGESETSVALRAAWRGQQDSEAIGPSSDRALEREQQRLASSFGAPEEPQRLLRDLESHPPQRQEALVRNHRRYWRPELCDLLLTWSHEARFSDTALMRHRARLAVLISAQLESTTSDEQRLIEDSRVRAWAGLGNALRVSGDLNSAEQALAVAQDHLENGNGGEALRAHLLSQLASLRFDQQRFEASLILIKQVVRIWRGLRNPLEVARALTKQAIATGESGKPGSAVQILLEAGRLIDRGAEPRLALIILHNMIRFHVDGGRSKVALELFTEARQLYERETDPLIRVKALWLEGQILSAVGHLEPAIRKLSAAREGFLAQGNRYEAAIVALDLAAGFAKLGRFEAMRELAGETMREMEARGVQRDAVAALLLLMQAANSEVALLLIRRAARAGCIMPALID